MPSARHLPLVVAFLLSGLLLAQDDSSSVRHPTLNPWDLANGSAEVPGMGDDVPGLNLVKEGNGRLQFGDSIAYASSDLVDTAWQKLRSSNDTVLPGTGVHWLRFRFLPASLLKGQALLLGLGGNEKLSLPQRQPLVHLLCWTGEWESHGQRAITVSRPVHFPL
ncbi:MAG: hypothetical protein IPH00_16015 [Flavobacteriales bacterium]|nr:hypothetical protein [Flavobacteriales bacterium]